MSKYRLLHKTELQELEKEFIEYLVVNGITADDWVKMKNEAVDKAEQIIELFSDVVFEDILRKIKYIEHRSKKRLMVFQCLPEELVMVAMEGDDSVDFIDEAFIKAASAQAPQSLRVYTSRKKYNQTRELELFELLQKGAVITNDQLFKALCLSLTN